MSATTSDNGFKPWSRSFASLLTSIMLAAILGAMGWLFTITQRVTTLEVRAGAIESRITAMETGRTTPMAAETRAELNAVWREIDRIRPK